MQRHLTTLHIWPVEMQVHPCTDVHRHYNNRTVCMINSSSVATGTTGPVENATLKIDVSCYIAQYIKNLHLTFMLQLIQFCPSTESEAENIRSICLSVWIWPLLLLGIQPELLKFSICNFELEKFYFQFNISQHWLFLTKKISGVKKIYIWNLIIDVKVQQKWAQIAERPERKQEHSPPPTFSLQKAACLFLSFCQFVGD